MMSIFKKDALIKAVREGDTEKLRTMLEKGANPNFEYYGTYPLKTAIIKKQAGAVRLLVTHGADSNRAIYNALDNGSPEIVPLLVELGVEIKISDLFFAAKTGRLESLAFLMEKTPDLDINQLYNGETLLHKAASEGYAKIAAHLLEKGADPDIEDHFVRTPLFWSQHKNHKEVEALLLPVTTNIAAPAANDAAAPGWKKLGDERVALVTEDPAIGYRTTEIFNFHARDYARIMHNLETKSEAMSLKAFDDFTDTAPLEEALQELNARGGKADSSSISSLRKNNATLSGGPA